MSKSNNVDPLTDLVHRIFTAGYEAGKRSGLTMVIASDTIEPAAVAEFRQLMVQERLEARIAELQQLVDFVAMAKFYDQDSAMKLRYHLDKRIAALRSERSQLTPKEN